MTVGPRIAVCIPSGRTWDAEMGLALVALGRETQLDMNILWFASSQISFSRNELVKQVLSTEADYAFWLDSDMIVPPSTIYELLAHKKDIVGATYLRRRAPFNMLGKMDRADGRLKPATWMPGGCMLIKADVYRALDWPWYYEKIVPGNLTWQEGFIQSEDIGFCEKAISKGYEIWCDINLSQRVEHIGQQNIRMQLKEGHPDRVEV